MKPLIVLIITYCISLLIIKWHTGAFDHAKAGQISMSIMLLFTSIAHFAYTKGMAMMLPEFIPAKEWIVYLTGLIEIAAAIGLFTPSLRFITACLLIAFFILILPANVYAAIKQVNYQSASYDGGDLGYLWFRIPLQFLFIIWTYLSCIR